MPTAVNQFPLSEVADDRLNDEAREFGFYIQKGLFEEYASFGRGHGHDPRRSILITRRVVCAGRWWTAKRRAGATVKVSTAT